MKKIKIKIVVPAPKERRHLPPPPRIHRSRRKYYRPAEKRAAKEERPE